ncbi:MULTISPECIES: hypothetical protein [Burkholderiaceae]|jgi:hypothetical protein|uniref:Uncharacterized protein n=1 Tax=Caballeronia sordidicola TaxID=196367 RepID=A0A242N0X0_CABSO|nr:MULTISPECIES: hypothetical protein [Burkholderiaceae]OTP77330.1 hypothetical protein PAMC26510_09055 [Caballeronia sordidicola]
MTRQIEHQLSESSWLPQRDVATIARQACSDAIPVSSTGARGATPPATYFISVLELATGEKLGNNERLRAIAMLEAHFAAGRPRTLNEAVRICAGAIDSSTLRRMARGAGA